MQCIYGRAVSLISILGFAFGVGSASANPKGGVVVAGTATISAPKASVLNIKQSTNSAVIDWTSFSIARGEKVDFLQPSASSSTLNRVLDKQVSVIDGTLEANGRILLLNSSGILFGDHASVNVNGLIASTSSVATNDFMAGRLNFTAPGQPGAAVENRGSITTADGGFAALVAPTVRNSGIISARLGRIVLGAGEVFTVDLYGDQLINFAVPTRSSAARTVTQSGSLIADSGRVLITTDAAAGIVHGVVNMSGTVQANSAAQLPSGAIVLSGGNTDISVTGTLSAKGEMAQSTGGSIDLLGRSVELGSSARVDASGVAGGGTVRVGGGFRDKPAMRVANSVSLEPGAIIDVSAIETGDAGKVAVWGRSAVNMAGVISARGGSSAGNGGYIEVSGENSVKLPGTIAAQAPSGHGGTLFLDPANITIQPIGGSSLTASTIAGAAIDSLLRQGVSVQLVASETITVNDIVDGRPFPGENPAASSGAFSLQSGSILVLQPIITNNSAVTLVSTSGDIIFRANSYVAVTNAASSAGIGSAPITLASAGNVTANQLVSLGPVTVTATGNVQLLQALNGLQGATGPTGIGSLNVKAQGTASVDGVASNADVSISGTTGVTLTAPVLANGDLTLSASSPMASITVAAASAASTAGAAAGGGIVIATPGAVMLNGSLLSRDGNILIGSSTQPVGTVTIAPGASLQSVDAGTMANQNGGISVYTAAALSTQDLIAGASGAVLLDSQGAVTLNKGLFGLAGSTGIGSLTIQAAGNVITEGATATGPISITSTGGSLQNSTASLISNTGPINLHADAITLAAVSNAKGTQAAVLDSTGEAMLTATGGAVTLNGGVVTGGTLVINATGNITTTGAQAANALSIVSGGTLQNSTASLVVANGPINLQANSINIGAVTNASGGTPVAVLDAGGPITVTSSSATTLGGTVLSAGAGLSINAGADVTISGAKTAGAIDVTSTAGTIQNSITGLDAGGSIAFATPGALSINTPLRSRSGNIQIGTQTQRVGSVNLSGAVQSVDSRSAPQTNGISIYSVGGVNTQNLIAGSQGAVTIDSSQGSVTVNSGMFGLTSAGTAGAGPGIGALTINAANNVATHGAEVESQIEITSGGTLKNSAAALISTNGSIVLTAAAITLNQIPPNATSGGVPGEALHAAADAILETSGAVNINSEIEAGRNIQIGTDANPIRSLATTLPSLDVLLQSDAAAGRIDVRSAGPVATSSLVTGTSGVVDLVGTDVTVAGSINDATGSQGVGDLTITGTGTNGITVNDIRVSGAAHDANGNSLALNSGTRGGTISILGPINSGGSIFIGQTGPYVPDGDPHTATPANSQINLSNNITTSGQSVTLNGDVTLFKGITRWDIECAITGVCLPSHNPVDARLFSNGIGVLSLGSSDTVEIYEPAFTAALAAACDPATSCSVSFQSSATTITACPTCTVSRYDPINPAAAFINCTPSCAETQGVPPVPTTVVGPKVDVSSFFATVTVPNDQALAFSKLTEVAVGADGTTNGVGIYNRQSGGSKSDLGYACSNSFVCGINQSDFSSSNPQLQQSAVTLATGPVGRLAVMNRLFGVLTATINTTANNHPSGADVTINGNVSRYRGPPLPTLPTGTPGQTANTTFYPDPSGYIGPSFVSDAININAGSSAAGNKSAVVIGGNLGDDLAQAGKASLTLSGFPGGGPASIDPGVSELGALSVSLTADTVQLKNSPTQYQPVQNQAGTLQLPSNCTSGYCLTGLTITATNSCLTGAGTCAGTALTGFADLGFGFLYGVTSPASGVFTKPTNFADPGTGSGSSSSAGSGGTVTGTVVASGNSAAGGAGGSGSNSIGGAYGSAGLSGLPSVTETESVPPTTILSTQNSTEYSASTSSSDRPPASAANDSCPRGAAQLADMGQRPAYGVTPNVFGRCRKE